MLTINLLNNLHLTIDAATLSAFVAAMALVRRLGRETR